MFCLTLFFLLLAKPFFTACQDGPIVNTTLGPILGKVLNSRNGADFYSFRGVRYAKAPVGELRFKPPVPVEPWDEILDATEDGPACPQLGWPNQSEDCLCLNVYTRRLGDEKKKPVLVYIHGGGYAHFTGQSTLHGPDYLMDHDIVLVTINYRLGTLGFFSTGDNCAAGNYGMKDQVLALKWVQANIQFFGGDPNNVTIAGESAGTGAVGLHLVSEMSVGLYHGAIMQSSSIANTWMVNRDPMTIAKKVADQLNCPTDSSKSMVDCLREIPAENIVAVYDNVFEWNGLGVNSWPVIEPENGGCERFLDKNPVDLLLEGRVADVPTFIGVTKDELISQALSITQNEEWLADLSANWTTLAPIIFFYEPNDTVSQILREFYFGSNDKPLTNESLTGLSKLFSDAGIIFGAVRSAKLLSEKNTNPVYLYQFSYQGDYSLSYWPGTNTPIGVAHGDDMFYIFYFAPFTPKFNTTSDDGQCVTRFTTLWKNFVETGNPTPEPSEDLNNVIWTPYTNEKPTYVDIGEKITSVDGLYFEDRIALWETLFPIEERKKNYAKKSKRSKKSKKVKTCRKNRPKYYK